MNSRKLLEQVKIILGLEGIQTTRIAPADNAFVLRITKQGSINSYLARVGFSNNHHLTQIKAFSTHPNL
tara:strand:+ start:3105 stop:3311 length:207 start_codon:yes stop_codon:yes gene_type:complete